MSDHESGPFNATRFSNTARVVPTSEGEAPKFEQLLRARQMAYKAVIGALTEYQNSCEPWGETDRTIRLLGSMLHGAVLQDLSSTRVDMLDGQGNTQTGIDNARGLAQDLASIVNAAGYGLIKAMVVRSEPPELLPGQRSMQSPWQLEITVQRVPDEVGSVLPQQAPKLEETSTTQADTLKVSLRQATTFNQIRSLLNQLEALDVTLEEKTDKGVKPVKPAELVARMERVKAQVYRAQNLAQLREALKLLPDEYQIRSKIGPQLEQQFTGEMMPQLQVLESAHSTVEEILTALQRLADLHYLLVGLRPEAGNTVLVNRRPFDEVRIITDVWQKKDKPQEVQHMILNVTSMFDLDMKVYYQIRKSWNMAQKFLNPVPEHMKERFEAVKKQVKRRS